MSELQKDILALINKYHKPAVKFIAGESHVPVSGRIYNETDMSLLIESALDFVLTTGRFNDEFEEKLAKYLGVSSLMTVNSGSSANLVAFSSLTSHLHKEKSVQAGDEVITVAAGFPTTVNPILQHGCIPVFVDVDIPTYNINVNLIEQAITPKTKAIMLAHTLGNPYNLEVITAIAKKYNLWLVEDCCDALGSTYNGKLVGTFGDAATLSFYPAHHITTGEGGAVFTNNPTVQTAALSIRDWGRDCWCNPGCDNTCQARFNWKLGELPKGYDHKYIYSHLGYNLKITDMQAAVGVGQLKHLPNFITKRKENFAYLKQNLKQFEEFLILPEATLNSDPSWFGFPITIKSNAPFKRNELLIYLNKNKIATRLLFAGNLTKQPYMLKQKYKIASDLINTDIIMNDTFWIGVYPGLNQDMLNYVVENFQNFIKSKKNDQ